MATCFSIAHAAQVPRPSLSPVPGGCQSRRPTAQHLQEVLGPCRAARTGQDNAADMLLRLWSHHGPLPVLCSTRDTCTSINQLALEHDQSAELSWVPVWDDETVRWILLRQHTRLVVTQNQEGGDIVNGTLGEVPFVSSCGLLLKAERGVMRLSPRSKWLSDDGRKSASHGV